MDKIKKTISCLEAMLRHCSRVAETITRFGNDCSKFESDLDFFDSVTMNILQIGELANHLPSSVRDKYQNIPWKRVIGQRNVVAHGYGTLVKERIWKTATEDVPVFQKQLQEILSAIKSDK